MKTFTEALISFIENNNNELVFITEIVQHSMTNAVVRNEYGKLYNNWEDRQRLQVGYDIENYFGDLLDEVMPKNNIRAQQFRAFLYNNFLNAIDWKDVAEHFIKRVNKS